MLLGIALTALLGAVLLPSGVPPILDSVKRRVMARARARMFAMAAGEGIGPSSMCLPLAAFMIEEADKEGIRLVLQAGSVFWERMPGWLDDGVSPTHFGYQWSLEEARANIAMERFPEIHVWAGDPVRQDVVDASAGDFPAQCRAILDMDWPGMKPPPFLWASAEGIPKGACYVPDRDATLFAHAVLQGRVATVARPPLEKYGISPPLLAALLIPSVPPL